MLWWRLIADAVLTMMPEVVAGTLPEEELLPEQEQPTLVLNGEKPPLPPTPAATVSQPPPTPPAVQRADPVPAEEPKPPAVAPPGRPVVTAAKDPTTGYLSGETIGALIRVIGGNAELARAWILAHGWLTAEQSASPDWLAYLPLEKANQVLRKPEGFQNAILKPKATA